jgi:hypothetical protein
MANKKPEWKRDIFLVKQFNSTFILFILLSSPIAIPLTFADTLSDAYTKKVQASQSYYRELRKLGPKATPQQKEQLRAKTIGPAQAEWSKSINQTVLQRTIESKQGIQRAIRNRLPAEAIAKLLNPSASSEKPSTKTKTPTAPSASEGNHGPVLDGSKVPKELSFPKRD